MAKPSELSIQDHDEVRQVIVELEGDQGERWSLANRPSFEVAS